MKHPIRRRLMYLGFQGLRAFAQALPLSLSGSLGRGLGLAAYAILGTQRRLAIEHLRFAFGGALSPSQYGRIARGVFVHLGRNALEWLSLPKLSLEAIQKLVSAEGVDHIRKALAEGNGAILVTAHFGNWELIPLYLRALGFEGGVLARRLRYPEYESFLISMRGARGVPTFARGSLKEVARLLRANQIVGMLPDQDVDSLEGIFVDFFDRPTYTPLGPAALSLMTGAPILPCFIVREKGRFRLVIEPAVKAPQGVDRSQAMAILTQAWSRMMESYIRRYPDQWVWMHRRWKTQPQSADGGQPKAESPAGFSKEASLDRGTQPALSLMLCALSCLLCIGSIGCAKPTSSPRSLAEEGSSAAAGEAEKDPAQQMSEFTLTGYEPDGSKRWTLDGRGANIEGNVVTIHHPDAVGYDLHRKAYLKASLAQFNQQNRYVRMEHDVTVHTSDGLWLSAPFLYWIPDQNQVTTDTPVRLETDHMLLRGRGARGLTGLKHATILEDIELVLNPSERELPSGGAAEAATSGEGWGKQVTITCEGPLSLDYEQDIATFEKDVHIKDPSGDLYADKLIAYLDRVHRTIRYAEAIGNVRIEQHQNTARSERAVYEPAIGKITLVGKPSLLIYPSEEGAVQSASLPFDALAPASAAPASAPASVGKANGVTYP